MALTKDQILDGIAELTVIELKDLLDAFEGDVSALLRRLDGAEGPVRR